MLFKSLADPVDVTSSKACVWLSSPLEESVGDGSGALPFRQGLGCWARAGRLLR